MEFDSDPDSVILSEDDRALAVAALVEDGRHELAEALQQTGPDRKIKFSTVGLIASSIARLNNGSGPSAEAFLSEIDELNT